jgi:hypothetical protein
MAPKTKPNRFESYEVYDHQGNPVGRVVLPRQSRFLGSERGTVYLNRQPALHRNGSTKSNPQAA